MERSTAGYPSKRGMAILLSGEVLFLIAYMVSRFGLFIDHLEETAEPVVSATFVVYGLLPMALGAFLIVIGLFRVFAAHFGKAPARRMNRMLVVAVAVGITILGVVLSKIPVLLE